MSRVSYRKRPYTTEERDTDDDSLIVIIEWLLPSPLSLSYLSK